MGCVADTELTRWDAEVCQQIHVKLGDGETALTLLCVEDDTVFRHGAESGKDIVCCGFALVG